MNRSRRGMLAGLGGGALGTAGLLGLGAQTAAAQPESAGGPLLGSWLVQVHFVNGPRVGVTEQSLITFIGGGGIVEVDGFTAQAHAGAWISLGNNQFVYTIVELMYSASGALVSDGVNPTIVSPRVQFTLEGNTFHSTSDVATVYYYTPNAAGGLSVASTQQLPNVSQVTGLRIASNFSPPNPLPL